MKRIKQRWDIEFPQKKKKEKKRKERKKKKERHKNYLKMQDGLKREV